ncbi:hypothetical protein ACGFW5_01220 [Streptomyces sp. NPDC048416]|uniref:hypothetical protein n=1 Tax=Streptomyces sp. NPDC048416 TaxID=3365546 RepID=UPI0037176237
MTAARTHLVLATGLRPGEHEREPTEVGMRVVRWPLDQAVDAVQSGSITDAGSVSALLLAHLARWTGQPPPPAAPQQGDLAG